MYGFSDNSLEYFRYLGGTWYCCYTRLPSRACRASDNFQNWLKSVIFLLEVTQAPFACECIYYEYSL